MACVLIMVLLGLMGFGVQKLRSKAVSVRNESNETKKKAEEAQQQKKIAEIKLKTIDAKTAELRKVYTNWIPHFEKYRNSRVGEQKISELVRQSDVFLLSQRFNYQELNKGDLVSHALSAELVVEDDYTKTLNWLGKIEETIPSCRISKLKIIRGDRGNDINMELSIQVPAVQSSLVAN